jgi:hypothetical protein
MRYAEAPAAMPSNRSLAEARAVIISTGAALSSRRTLAICSPSRSGNPRSR